MDREENGSEQIRDSKREGRIETLFKFENDTEYECTGKKADDKREENVEIIRNN